jgi:hypothetical protein
VLGNADSLQDVASHIAQSRYSSAVQSDNLDIPKHHVSICRTLNILIHVENELAGLDHPQKDKLVLLLSLRVIAL